MKCYYTGTCHYVGTIICNYDDNAIIDNAISGINGRLNIL